MKIIFNENTSIGKKQYAYIKEIYQKIQFLSNKKDLLEKLNHKEVILILIDGIAFNDIINEIKKDCNNIFFVFPPYEESINLAGKRIKIFTKSISENKYRILDKELKRLFDKDGIEDSEIDFFYSLRFESGNLLESVIINGEANIFSKIKNFQNKYSIFLTTIIVDQFSVMNKFEYIQNLHEYIINRFTEEKESFHYEQKQKSLIREEQKLNLTKQIYNLILLSLYYLISEKNLIHFEKETFWQVFKEITQQLRFNINLEEIEENEIYSLMKKKALRKYDESNSIILSENVIKELNRNHLVAIYRRIKVNI